MRLIDADKLIEEFEGGCCIGEWWFIDRVEESPTIIANNWISAKDSVPKHREVVLVYGIYHYEMQCAVCYYDAKIKFNGVNGRRKGALFSKIAGQMVDAKFWMPLPRPPESE